MARQKWKYMVTDVASRSDEGYKIGISQEDLNDLGNDGWELVCIDDHTQGIFKRPKAEEEG